MANPPLKDINLKLLKLAIAAIKDNRDSELSLIFQELALNHSDGSHLRRVVVNLFKAGSSPLFFFLLKPISDPFFLL